MHENNLKKYKLTQKLVAKYFGYASSKAFYSSSANDRILKGVSKIIAHIENKKRPE